MGLFHVKRGTPASKALPDKSTLKDGASICMEFCSHKKKCNYPHQLCKNGKHYTNWKKVLLEPSKMGTYEMYPYQEWLHGYRAQVT
jgi:hypothetical protein